MGFNPLVYARLVEKTVNKQNPFKFVLNTVIYAVLTIVNLPYKMRLLDARITEYKKRIDKYDQIINQPPERSKVGKKFDFRR